MAAIDHWQPVLRASRLRTRPVGVEVCGERLVLFRDGRGRVGALADRCPHRGMRLSKGWLAEGRLVCPYHGWSFDTRGEGRSAGTPRLSACAPHYETAVKHGLIWVKAEGEGGAGPIPDLEYPGLHRFSTLHRRVKVPLLLLLDNFTEIEHTPTGHFSFGYSLDGLAEVRTQLQYDERTIHVSNVGPQRKLPWMGAMLFGTHTGDQLLTEWTTHFSPLHVVYEARWKTPSGDRDRAFRLRYVIFFTPVNDRESELFGFYYSPLGPWGRLGLNVLPRLIAAVIIEVEFLLDRRLVENLADTSTSLRGNVLGRFDRQLLEQRRRLERTYLGTSHETTVAQDGATSDVGAAEVGGPSR